MKYDGVIKDLEIRVGEELVTKTHVAVVRNPDLYMLIGNDVVGGPRSLFKRIAMNDEYGFMTLASPERGVVENVHFLRNVEIMKLPVSMLSRLEDEPEGSVVELFR